MLDTEILFFLISYLNLVCLSEEHWYIELLSWQFSNITIEVRIVGKIQDQHFNALLSSNPGDKVLFVFWDGNGKTKKSLYGVCDWKGIFKKTFQ